MAACSGGIITAATLGHLADDGRLDAVASLTLLVCALDNEQAGTPGALATRELAAAAVAESARRGYLDGEALATVFAWLRPNDLIWNYAINNYLLGKQPPAFDILYWNQDTVRLAAGLHRDFIRLALDNALARPAGDGPRLRRSTCPKSTLDNTSSPAPTTHVPVAEQRPLDPAARRPLPVRALDQRSHPGVDQPPRPREQSELPGLREPTRCDSRRLGERCGDAAGQLVARLHPVALSPFRRPDHRHGHSAHAHTARSPRRPAHMWMAS